MKRNMYKKTAVTLMFSLAATGLHTQAAVLQSTEDIEAQEAQADDIAFTEAASFLEAGVSFQFGAEAVNVQGAIKWKSSNSKVVKINAKGYAKALSAGTATITAKVKNAKARIKVSVYPSLQEISDNNDIYKNLRDGRYLFISAVQEAAGVSYASILGKAQEQPLMIRDGGSITSVFAGNLRYDYSKENKLVSIYAADDIAQRAETASQKLYETFSSEKVTDVTYKSGICYISTESNIADMTEKEQREAVGLSVGAIKKKLAVDTKSMHLTEYDYTILADEADGGFEHTISRKYTYGEEDLSAYVPEHVSIVMAAEKTRTVTLVDCQKEEPVTTVYTIPDSMPLYFVQPAETEVYTDDACTQIYEGAVKNEDGTYPSVTLYLY